MEHKCPLKAFGREIGSAVILHNKAAGKPHKSR